MIPRAILAGDPVLGSFDHARLLKGKRLDKGHLVALQVAVWGGANHPPKKIQTYTPHGAKKPK